MISKSAFKVFFDCPIKLKYRLAKYPSANESNEYLDFFADCGFMVEALARALYPQGMVPAEDNKADNTEATKAALSASNCVLFEPSFRSGLFTARIDILEKKGRSLHLIEIKAKSYDPETDENLFDSKGNIRDSWREYIYDVAFQKMVVTLATGMPVTPYLCLVDKSRVSSEEAIFENVRLLADNEIESRSTPRATYSGDVEKLRNDHLLKLLDVSRYVDFVMDEVFGLAQEAARCAEDPSQFPSPPLSSSCKACEYRVGGSGQNGFAECWGGDLPNGSHITDLYFASQMGKKGDFDKLVREGARSIADIPVSLVNSSGSRGQRQRMQIEAFTTQREQIKVDELSVIRQVSYPIYFMDFEASRLPLPYHVGMNPYEQVPFQFSCHVKESPSSKTLLHHEWINVVDVYPSAEFARELRSCLGSQGTIVVWSPYEQAALRDIVRQNEKYRMIDHDLSVWIDSVHGAHAEGGRVLDLMRVCQAAYCHPDMGGSTSIKAVLKAIWNNSPELQQHEWFREYLTVDDKGVVLSPYDALPEIPDVLKGSNVGASLEAVRNGVGAMRAYQEMLYGINKDDAQFKMLAKELLLQYCKLDTLAMVIIWEYWNSRLERR